MKRSTLMALFASKLISRRIFIILYMITKRRERMAREMCEDDWVRERFTINLSTKKECHRKFRFHKPDLKRLRQSLQIPDTIITKQRLKVSGIEALCILLYRMAYPSR